MSKKKKEVSFDWPLKDFGKKAKERIKPFRILIRDILGLKESEGYAVGKIKEEATLRALSFVNTSYDVYKKTHGMVTW